MSKEQQQIIDEAYENFVNWVLSEENQNNKNEIVKIPASKEIFIKRIKGGNEIIKKMGKIYCDKFSERWGLTIEERELSFEERWELGKKHGHIKDDCEIPPSDLVYMGINERETMIGIWNDPILNINIPTRLITITYNNKTIESYE